MNLTERKYLREIIMTTFGRKINWTYEPEPLVITKTTKRRYTPDFLLTYPAQDIDRVYHEVKGTYKLHSQDRARLAWELAAETHPQYTFYWAELKGRGWEIERWAEGGKDIRVHLAGWPLDRWENVGPDWRRHKPRKRSTGSIRP